MITAKNAVCIFQRLAGSLPSQVIGKGNTSCARRRANDHIGCTTGGNGLRKGTALGAAQGGQGQMADHQKNGQQADCSFVL